jgi:hypothetical protein
MARIIAAKIGAVSLTDHSNEFAYDGTIVTIRCAQLGDNQVGVLYTMLQRIDLVIGAFEEESGTYKLMATSPHLYKTQLRDSKNEGKVGLVRKTQFEELGKTISTIKV